MGTKRANNVMKLMGENAAGPSTKRIRVGNTVTTTQRRNGTTITTRQELQKTSAVHVRPTQDLERINDMATTEKKDEIKEETKKETKEKTNNSSKGSRHSPTLGDFEDIMDDLTNWFVQHEYDADLNTTCSCGEGIRVVHCQDCQDFELCCEECWLLRHRQNPWHWARVWNGSFFVRSDISVLREDGFAVQLGHHGEPCPYLDKPRPVSFTVVHSNGVHGTMLSFCNCKTVKKVEQLMRSRLFPSSVHEPETAYTFAMMREYDVQALQGQFSAYDWVHSLRRLTDNAHTHLVNDPYNPFMLAARVWRFIHDRLRYGVVYSLLRRTLPHLPPNTFVTRCPACPDPDMNMEEGWWRTPQHLRHLTMMYTTLDGNSKTRRFRKRGGDGDYSLYRGQAYYPDDERYAEFLREAAKKKMAEPIPDCDNIKSVARLTELAAHGMAVTGTVNHQCSHVFIMGVTDMFSSENQANVDAAFSRGYTLYGYEDDKISASTSRRKDVPHKQSYDAECAYAVNQLIRFATFDYLGGQREFVQHLERGIPVVHLTGHKVLLCKILFALFYHWCNGHFTGEGAEQAWPYMNRVATYSCQAGPGHRHDLHIVHYNDYNRKKTINLAYLIARELVVAAAQLETHMLLFQQLSLVHDDEVAEWSLQDLVPHENPKVAGSWSSAYHRSEGEMAPSVAMVLESFAGQGGSGITLPNIGLDVEIYWRKALEVEDTRELIAVLTGKSHLTQTETTTLENLRSRMLRDLEEFRRRQALMTPRLPDRFSEGSCDSVEGSTLGLPSEMTREERLAYGAGHIAAQEVEIRKSHAHGIVESLQSTCRRIEVLNLYKEQNVSTDSMRTRTGKSIDTVVDARNQQLALYNHSRRMLIELDAIRNDDSEFPPLSGEDTTRKDVYHKRRTGDSKRREGRLWTLTPLAITKLPEIPLGVDRPEDVKPLEELPSATNMSQRAVKSSRAAWDGLVELTKKGKKTNKDPTQAAPPQTSGEKRDAKRDKQYYKPDNEGLLWTMGSRRGTRKQVTVDEFEEESDRISWTRQQAEVYRWMEEFERKHAEFHRLIRYYRRMESAWRTVADDPEALNETVEHPKITSSPKVSALRARALRQAAVWGDLATVATYQFRKVAYPKFFDMDTSLVARVEIFRDEQLEWTKKLGIQRADLAYGKTKAGTERSKPADAKGKGKRRY
ncbi:hypothetical protein AAF712_010184 [Marasmius tenuissimus]|uniref:CxC2-like cysteine cluster KDZ transposase-associated domain-containing protein n=1 Tax=Marasmius tenuissimus TaxID=585030 RepID=A0ABR2ZRC3_9AGAR